MALSDSSKPSDNKIDFLIITPLEEERDAILERLPGHQKVDPSEDDVHVYFRASLSATFPSGSTGTYQIAVMPLLGMGRVEAATATDNGISCWNPRYVILVGIAGGVEASGVGLGDILVADRIIDYELQKLTSRGPDIRWKVYNVSQRLLGASKSFIGESWHSLVHIKRPKAGNPRRHIGPIASGDKVIDFAEALTRYRETWSKLIGVEMEAGGVAPSVLQTEKRAQFFMIRGASDLADGDKNTPKTKKWRPYACDVAAAYTIGLLRSGPVPFRREMQKPPTLDTQILQTLYTYYLQNPGSPQMSLGELVATCPTERGNLMRCLLGLREKNWVDYDLTVSADTGLVWLTALGIGVAKDVQRNESGK